MSAAALRRRRPAQSARKPAAGRKAAPPPTALPLMTHAAMAHPWLCDAQGHLNARHHYALFDEAMYFLLAAVTADDRPLNRRTRGFADVHAEVDFLAEVPLGTVVCVHLGIERIGRTSLTVVAEMRAAASDRLFGRYRATTVHVDLKAGRARPLPPAMRARAARFQLAPAGGARPAAS